MGMAAFNRMRREKKRRTQDVTFAPDDALLPDFESMTVAGLRDYAAEQSPPVSLPGNVNKAELIDILTQEAAVRNG